MRTPIAYSLAWPARLKTDFKRLDLAAAGDLTFDEPDETRFPALRLAKEVLKEGGAASTVLNAANEIAVEAFLTEQHHFPVSRRWSSERWTRRRRAFRASCRTASKRSCTSTGAPARSRSSRLPSSPAPRSGPSAFHSYLSTRCSAPSGVPSSIVFPRFSINRQGASQAEAAPAGKFRL